MNALLTGGAGFIGSHLHDLLMSHGATLTVLDITPQENAWRLSHGPYKYIQGDIRDAGVVEEAIRGCDTVFHLAGLVGTDALIDTPEDAVATNVLGTLNVLQAARRTGALVVHASLTPDWPNSYMISKQAASKFCQMFYREFGSRVVDLRLMHVYGPRQTSMPVKKVIPTFLRAALLDQPIDIYGDGAQLLDLIYVSDAVRAFWLAANTEGAIGQSIEIGTGCAHRLLNVAEIILQQSNSKSSMRFVGRRSGEPESPVPSRAADTGKQKEVLAFVPQVPLLSGLDATRRWIESRL